MKITRRNALKWIGGGLAATAGGLLLKDKCKTKTHTTNRSSNNIQTIFNRFSIPDNIRNYADKIEGKHFTGSKKLLILITVVHNQLGRRSHETHRNIYQLLNAFRNSGHNLFLLEVAWKDRATHLANCPPNRNNFPSEEALINWGIQRSFNADILFSCSPSNSATFSGVEDLNLWFQEAALYSMPHFRRRRVPTAIVNMVENFGPQAVIKYRAYVREYAMKRLSPSEEHREHLRLSHIRSKFQAANAAKALKQHSSKTAVLTVGNSHRDALVKELEKIQLSYITIVPAGCLGIIEELNTLRR